MMVGAAKVLPCEWQLGVLREDAQDGCVSAEAPRVPVRAALLRGGCDEQH
jgi:hypothetical protein